MKNTLLEVGNIMEETGKDVVLEIVNRVYPQIVRDLGKSRYVNTPKVELHKDIYARLSGDEEARGEHSTTSKAQYDGKTNTIYIYYPNMVNEEEVIRTLLHEYTHSLQDPSKNKKHRELGYKNNPYETAAARAEWGWEKYKS